MKHVLGVWLTLAAVTFSAAAQGVVNFNNNVLSEPPDRTVYCLDGPLVGTNFVAQLTYGTDARSLVPHTATARFRPATTVQPGTWSGGNRTLTGAGGVGTTIFLQVRIWDSNAGATFDQARVAGGAWAWSDVFAYTQVLSSPPAATDTQMLNFQGFTGFFTCVPEPSMISLGLASGVLWLLFGRRKHS